LGTASLFVRGDVGFAGRASGGVKGFNIIRGNSRSMSELVKERGYTTDTLMHDRGTLHSTHCEQTIVYHALILAIEDWFILE